MDAPAGPPTAPPTASVAPRPEHGALAQFMLSLIKAMIQTGYYAADHPEAKKALSSLYREFRQVIGDRSELTCLLAGTQSGRAILIDGYEATPLSLDQVMMKGMAQLFTPKFTEFFDRWALLSFSLKADLTAEEFQAFVELMAQLPVAGPDTGHERQRLTQALLDHHILHISTVFNDDLVGRERRLSWRVQMALSRLRRDLRMLPLYQRATPEQLRRIKIQIIDDVVRGRIDDDSIFIFTLSVESADQHSRSGVALFGLGDNIFHLDFRQLFFAGKIMNRRPICNVVKNRNRKWVRTLEYHPDFFSQCNNIVINAVYIIVVQ